MKGIWLAGKPFETVAHVWNPKHISLRINGVSRNSHRFKQGQQLYIMTWIMIDNTSKASCGLDRNPALRRDKYPLCPVYGTRFQTQVRIQILHLSLMNYLSHHVLTNNSIYSFLCRHIIFWIPFSNFWMHLVVFNVTFLTSIFEITYAPRWFGTHDRGFTASWLQHFTTVPRKTRHMYCKMYIYI